MIIMLFIYHYLTIYMCIKYGVSVRKRVQGCKLTKTESQRVRPLTTVGNNARRLSRAIHTITEGNMDKEDGVKRVCLDLRFHSHAYRITPLNHIYT